MLMDILIAAAITGLIVLGARKQGKEWAQDKTQKPCPKCAERVKKEAEICRYCAHNFL